MRILHLTTEFPPVIYGGLGTAVGGLVEASANAGMAVGVLLFGQTAGSGYGKFVPLPEAATNTVATRLTAGVTIFEVSWFQGIESLAQIVARWQPELLHLHSFWLWPIAQALRDRLGKPLVYTVHSLVSCPRNSMYFVAIKMGRRQGARSGAYLKRYVTDEQRRRRPIFIATLRAAASWPFFCVALSKGLLMACAASASRIWLWPVGRVRRPWRT